jgi:hypothetical protein
VDYIITKKNILSYSAAKSQAFSVIPVEGFLSKIWVSEPHPTMFLWNLIRRQALKTKEGHDDYIQWRMLVFKTRYHPQVLSIEL